MNEKWLFSWILFNTLPPILCNSHRYLYLKIVCVWVGRIWWCVIREGFYRMMLRGSLPVGLALYLFSCSFSFDPHSAQVHNMLLQSAVITQKKNKTIRFLFNSSFIVSLYYSTTIFLSTLLTHTASKENSLVSRQIRFYWRA